MGSPRRGLAVFVVLAAAALLPRPAEAQLLLGQYEDEAPLRTWNSFPFASAAALGRGETAYAWPGDAAAVLANPALLFSLPRATATIGGSLLSASYMKYGPVNTGVFQTTGPLSLVLPAFDLAAATCQIGRWAFGLAVCLSEIYDRPLAEYIYQPQNAVLYRIRFEQSGFLRDVVFSAGYRVGPGFSLGLAVHAVAGRWERRFLEEWTSSGIKISDEKERRFRGVYLSGGVFWDAGKRLQIAAVVRMPYRRTGKSDSRVRYQAGGQTDIAIDGTGDDAIRQPLAAGVGAQLTILRGLKAALDMTYTDWSAYEAEWFTEAQKRDFIGTFKGGGGLEYQMNFDLFAAPSLAFFRGGLCYDPQPMTNPRSSYLGYTAGIGFRRGGLAVDAGFLLARESGSGDELEARRAALSVGYGF